MIAQYFGIDSDYLIIALMALVLILIILMIVHVVQMNKLKKTYQLFIMYDKIFKIIIDFHQPKYVCVSCIIDFLLYYFAIYFV